MTTGVGRARCDAHNFVENPKSPKPDHPKKVDFDPFSTSLYRPIRTLFRDGAKMVIFEGSRPQNRKKALFCKKTWSGGAAERVWSCDLLCNNHLFPHSCVRSPASFEAQSENLRKYKDRQWCDKEKHHCLSSLFAKIVSGLEIIWFRRSRNHINP